SSEMLVKTTGASARSGWLMFLSELFKVFFVSGIMSSLVRAGNVRRVWRMVARAAGQNVAEGRQGLQRSGFHDRQHLSFGNNIVDVDEDGFEPAGGGRSDRDFHFHRFDEYDVLAVTNAAADLNRQRADASGHFGYDLDLWHFVLRGSAARSRACAL